MDSEPKFEISEEIAGLITSRLISDAESQKLLSEKPIDTLMEWGVEVNDETQEKYKDFSMEEIYMDQFGQPIVSGQNETGLIPAVLVAVATRGTRPATNTRSRTAVTSVTGTTTVTTTATATKTIFDARENIGVPVDDTEFNRFSERVKINDNVITMMEDLSGFASDRNNVNVIGVLSESEVDQLQLKVNELQKELDILKKTSFE